MALIHCPECGKEISDQAASPMTFWKTVGAILTALLIWTVVSWLLASLFHSF